MRTVVINTGTEILLGDVLNTHLGFIARQILELGLRIAEQRTLPDGTAIQSSLKEILLNTDIVFVTGGLGPTTDDVTRELVADLLQIELVENSDLREAIRSRLAGRNVPATPRIWRQAMVPVGAQILPNEHGTAPGIYLQPSAKSTRGHLFLLPGPPRELEPMFRKYVMPILRRIAQTHERPVVRKFRVARMGESIVEKEISEELLTIPGLEIGYCARPGEVDVRVSGSPEIVQKAADIIRAKLSDAIFSSEEEQLAEVLVRALSERAETIALAESCTGGLLSHELTNVSGASRVLISGIVAYSNEEKTRGLGVPKEMIAAHGAVSEEIAREMAERVKMQTGATYGIATTGIAGPTGGTAEKPVGTAFVAVALKEQPTRCEKVFFPGDRETFKDLVALYAFDLLRRHLR